MLKLKGLVEIDLLILEFHMSEQGCDTSDFRNTEPRHNQPTPPLSSSKADDTNSKIESSEGFVYHRNKQDSHSSRYIAPASCRVPGPKTRLGNPLEDYPREPAEKPIYLEISQKDDSNGQVNIAAESRPSNEIHLPKDKRSSILNIPFL